MKEVIDAFNVFENYASTCDVEEATDTSSCVILVFASKFSLYTALIMAVTREWIVLVEGSDTTSDTTC